MSYQELSIQEIMNRFSISQATAYRMTKGKGWDFKAKPLKQGGRKKIYLVPEAEIPNEVVAPVKRELPDVVKMEVVEYDSTIPDLVPDIKIPELELHRAQLKAQLCEILIKEIDRTEVKKEAIETVLDAYNTGYLIPALFKIEGKRSERTLRVWLTAYLDSDKDFKSLVRLSKATRQMKATEIEQNFLLGLLLDANKIKIGSAIRKLKQLARLDQIESPTSERALRRWAESWRDSHIQEWNLLRLGKKYSKDNGLRSLLRTECLEVGDVWVADGHKLAFDIIDPVSGKPTRMMLILFFDWGSRYPVGASIANTEDSEHILMALRNGIIQWGGAPKFVYLDNGRAFKSKLFHDKWESHDLEKEFCGIFPRLGIEAEFAKAYNARAKVVERFFRTFQEDFERYMDTFRGAGIDDKPAFLKRNEKWIKNLRKREPLTIDKAKGFIATYIRDFYGRTPHGGLAGKTPLEVFEKGAVPDKRKIDISKLNFLMLKVEKRSVRANGIQMSNIIYYHDELMPYVGKNVILRYDLMDLRSILVYDEKHNLICQAFATKSTHPFVKLAKDKPLARKQWQKQLAHQRKIEKDLKKNSSIIRSQVEKATSEFMVQNLVDSEFLFSKTEMINHDKPTDTEVNYDTIDYDPIPPSEPILTEEELGMREFDKICEKLGI